MRKSVSALCLAAMAAALNAQAAEPNSVDCSALNGRIDVTGYGKVESAPDLAKLSFTVNSKQETASEARADAENKVTAFFKALGGLKIPKDKIIAESISVYPEYTTDKQGKRQLLDYAARRTVRVELEDFTLIGPVTDAAMQSGIDNIGGFSYALKDPQSAQLEADSKAIADARDKAERLAKGFGVTLGQPCSLQFAEGTATPVVRPRAMAMAKTASNDAVEAEYSQDTLTVSSRVKAVYAIR